MSSQQGTPPAGGTTSDDYTDCYYTQAHLGGYDNYSWDNEQWRAFNRGLADRLVAIANPKTTLDVGCAKGLLVQALAEQGVDARGIDLSEHAIGSAHPDVRPRLEVRSAAKPLGGTYDLISCIEVIEHMEPRDAQAAIDAMCAATDRILFSSSPGDFDEPTHINTHPTPDWVAAFAERGFYRRTDVNLDFLTPWAVLFERTALQPRDIVHRYESHIVPMAAELRDKRTALLAMHRSVSALHDEVAALRGPDGLSYDEATAQHISNLESQLEHARHDVLTTRDHIIGLEAEALRLQHLVDRLNGRLAGQQDKVQKLRTRLRNQQRRTQRAERKLQAVKESRAWRLGKRLAGSSTPEL